MVFALRYAANSGVTHDMKEAAGDEEKFYTDLSGDQEDEDEEKDSLNSKVSSVTSGEAEKALKGVSTGISLEDRQTYVRNNPFPLGEKGNNCKKE